MLFAVVVALWIGVDSVRDVVEHLSRQPNNVTPRTPAASLQELAACPRAACVFLEDE